MTWLTERIALSTRGDGHIVDLTPKVREMLTQSGFREGQVTVFAPGATAGITTIEYEPGLVRDLPLAFERIAPRDGYYYHHETWNDGNGHSHVSASILGPSLTIPFSQGSLILGTWQQVILIDFDNRPRRRDVIVQFNGE
ncbi:MAG TPA: secondary thiamine-phosphate synthase enzyme YjbQ [bacterium]|nr:secondary thiamine-phosphate synthase enzyme YjbQ [bacterium]HQL61162.1 secondary thiamine-phosphate synthase enzyme YjbQ [bacterium]